MKYYLYKFWKDWPITQEYGWTSFALKMKKRYEETGKQLYKYGIHSGIDFGVKLQPVYSPLNGIIKMDDDINDSGRGIALSVCDLNQLIACRFYHLNNNFVDIDQKVLVKEKLAITGKSAGKLTIGNEWHNHFEVVTINKDCKAIGKYNGAIDPIGENIVWLDNPADCV